MSIDYHRLSYGGRGEIRTHDRLPDAGFQDRCIQPLCHSSASEITYITEVLRKMQVFSKKDQTLFYKTISTLFFCTKRFS